MSLEFHYDLHTHTNFSDGRSPLRDNVNAALANGVRGMAVTDHVFSQEGAEKLLAEYAEVDRSQYPVKLMLGCETAVKDETGAPCASAETLSKFEIVLMDCNYILFHKFEKSRASPETLCDILCDVVAKTTARPEVNILAHPFNFGLAPLNLRLELFTDEKITRIADLCKKNNKIFEIMNQMYFWHGNIPFEDFHREYMRILNIMKKAGVKFSVGSDTHSCCGVGCLLWSLRAVEELGLKSSDLYLPETLKTGEMS